MNPFFFDEQMERMKSTFGEKNYTDERKKIIWRSVEKLSDFQFRRIIDRFIDKEQYAPMPEEFRLQAYKMLPKIESRPIYDEVFDLCHLCGDFGYVKVVTPTDKLVAKCSCKWGQTVGYPELPKFEEVNRDGWYQSRIECSWFVPHDWRPGQDLTHMNKPAQWKMLVLESIEKWKERGLVK